MSKATHTLSPLYLCLSVLDNSERMQARQVLPVGSSFFFFFGGARPPLHGNLGDRYVRQRSPQIRLRCNDLTTVKGKGRKKNIFLGHLHARDALRLPPPTKRKTFSSRLEASRVWHRIRISHPLALHSGTHQSSIDISLWSGSFPILTLRDGSLSSAPRVFFFVSTSVQKNLHFTLRSSPFLPSFHPPSISNIPSRLLLAILQDSSSAILL